mmetsp:Transcript_64086/g.169844  ORF Transcript_64086/g.169844 Transcript_64086/m.169844 type:complete len:217 (-) Transcript_64086:267-917(-)
MGLTAAPVGHGSATTRVATHRAAICDRRSGLDWLDTLPVQPASNVGNVQPLPHVIRVWPHCIHLQQNRLGILVNGERESHVPDRLSKGLTLCAETTAHVIQRHDDGRTLPTGALRTARAPHTGGDNASPQVDARDAHLCNLGEIQLQGAQMEVLLGTQSQCEARPQDVGQAAGEGQCVTKAPRTFIEKTAVVRREVTQLCGLVHRCKRYLQARTQT